MCPALVSCLFSLRYNRLAQSKGRFLAYECVLPVKEGYLLWVQNKHCHPTASPLLVLYYPLDAFPGNQPSPNIHLSNIPIHPYILTLTSSDKQLSFYSPLKGLDELYLLDVSLVLPRGPTLCLEGTASGFNPSQDSPLKNSRVVTLFV